jgi:anti-sigma regulatory factor (Ser/Thr protein kinase)
MTATFQRTLSRSVHDYVARAAEAEDYCTQSGLSRALMFKVRLVLEELVLNLIEHGTGSPKGRIDLRIDIEPARVVLTLEDDGDPFDPRSAPPFDKTRPLEERSPRGMGIQLVRSMSQEIAYERLGTRNRLCVVIAR